MQIAPGLYSIGQKKGGNVHAYLIDDGGSLILIDTLFDADAAGIIAEIAQAGKRVTDLKQIVITHAHRSHIGGLATLKKLSNATVCAHEWEKEIVAGQRKAAPVGLWPKPPLQVYHLQAGLALGLSPHTPCEVDQALRDGDHLGPLEVLSVPGHTPGCLAFYWGERRALFVGDVVVTWPDIAPGWPGLTLDNDQNLKSVGKLADAGGAEIACVGHGGPITRGASSVLRQLRDGKTPVGAAVADDIGN
jgi:glyoxylase-like metal-dependent hydrolase (beta-lactamase superfamily II)